MLLGQYQQFQSSANSLQAWMQACEANVEKLLSDTIASDPMVLQQQLATTKVSQDTGCWIALLLEYLKAKQILPLVKGNGWDAWDKILFLNTSFLIPVTMDKLRTVL